MAKPVDNAESFCAFLEWIIESGRGHRLDSLLISLPAYFSATQRRDLTKDDDVKRTIGKVKEKNPTRSLPKTTATSELLRKALELIPVLADTPFLAARETLTMSIESVTGMRCGEVFGAQMGHGVMANGVSILTWVGAEGYPPPPGVIPGDVFVEASTETSKTKNRPVRLDCRND